MIIEVLRLFYSLWLLGALVFLLNAISTLVFSKRLKGKRFKILLITPPFCLLWPLALCSPSGRKILFNKFHQL